MKRVSKRVRDGAARKSSPSRHGRKFRPGDRVRIIEIAHTLKDPDYDRKHDKEEPKLRTGELFRFCLGREFTVRGHQHDWIELDASEDPAVRKKFGKYNTIWSEPEFLKRVRTSHLKPKQKKRT